MPPVAPVLNICPRVTPSSASELHSLTEKSFNTFSTDKSCRAQGGAVSNPLRPIPGPAGGRSAPQGAGVQALVLRKGGGRWGEFRGFWEVIRGLGGEGVLSCSFPLSVSLSAAASDCHPPTLVSARTKLVLPTARAASPSHPRDRH